MSAQMPITADFILALIIILGVIFGLWIITGYEQAKKAGAVDKRRAAERRNDCLDCYYYKQIHGNKKLS
jgi:hypothetical protein